jgi:serine/threonine protein phosphatase PrpC
MITRDGVAGIGLEPADSVVLRYPWKPGAMLILFSDGLRSGWDVREYKDLLSHDPTVIAAVIFRDTVRNTDDATVVVVVDRTTG